MNIRSSLSIFGLAVILSSGWTAFSFAADLSPRQTFEQFRLAALSSDVERLNALTSEKFRNELSVGGTLTGLGYVKFAFLHKVEILEETAADQEALVEVGTTRFLPGLVLESEKEEIDAKFADLQPAEETMADIRRDVPAIDQYLKETIAMQVSMMDMPDDRIADAQLWASSERYLIRFVREDGVWKVDAMEPSSPLMEKRVRDFDPQEFLGPYVTIEEPS
ncbi:MAG: hypothetical protein Q8Q08_03430 [Candidatus Omnitrophota bacterium]|nr:hypothetical protein [Candidatus Omnitrophota bacterium]MDZ4243227.1 hypothetical protein [Candidatus Omnitrophota bacterium]